MCRAAADWKIPSALRPGRSPPPAPSPPPPRPTPISQGTLTPGLAPDVQARVAELIDHAERLREHGDTYAAVTKLRETIAIDPDNAKAWIELAETYEKMGAVDKSSEAYNHVFEMGEKAGPYFLIAKAKREYFQEHARRDAEHAQTPVVAAIAAGEVKEPFSARLPNARLCFLDFTRNDDPAAGTRNFTLLVPVRAKPRARIDVPDVLVQVLFYDLINNTSLDRTSAQVSYKWSTPPADWSERDVEVLEVSYLLPRVSDTARGFYGYVASLYYKNALQDFRADPPQLGEKLPPKKVLTEASE